MSVISSDIPRSYVFAGDLVVRLETPTQQASKMARNVRFRVGDLVLVANPWKREFLEY